MSWRHSTAELIELTIFHVISKYRMGFYPKILKVILLLKLRKTPKYLYVFYVYSVYNSSYQKCMFLHFKILEGTI